MTTRGKKKSNDSTLMSENRAVINMLTSKNTEFNELNGTSQSGPAQAEDTARTKDSTVTVTALESNLGQSTPAIGPSKAKDSGMFLH